MGAAKAGRLTLLQKMPAGFRNKLFAQRFLFGMSWKTKCQSIKGERVTCEITGRHVWLGFARKIEEQRTKRWAKRKTDNPKKMQGQNTMFYVLWLKAIQSKKYGLNEARWFAASNHSSATNTWRVKEETKWVNKCTRPGSYVLCLNNNSKSYIIFSWCGKHAGHML